MELPLRSPYDSQIKLLREKEDPKIREGEEDQREKIKIEKHLKCEKCGTPPDGPVVKESAFQCRTKFLPGRGTKISHASEQLSPRATTTEPTCSGLHASQLEREIPWATAESPNATKTRYSQIN